MIFKTRRRIFEFHTRPLVVGVVDISLSDADGGAPRAIEDALLRARLLVSEGADIVEVGIARAIGAIHKAGDTAEMTALVSFVEEWNRAGKALSLSIRTADPAVAQAVLLVGGDILYDVTSNSSLQIARTCAETGVGLLLGGMPPEPRSRIGSVSNLEFWEERISCIKGAGLNLDALAIAPEGGPEVYGAPRHLQPLNRPVLLTAFSEEGPIESRDACSIACVTQGLLGGAHFLRVQNVRAAVAALKIIGELV